MRTGDLARRLVRGVCGGVGVAAAGGCSVAVAAGCCSAAVATDCAVAAAVVAAVTPGGVVVTPGGVVVPVVLPVGVAGGLLAGAITPAEDGATRLSSSSVP